MVSGLSGAGKTTLIRGALSQISNLQYLRTVTTRPPRAHETSGVEYLFVSEETYQELASQSASWDHSEYQGYKYGADVAAVNRTIKRGGQIICALAPSKTIMQQMEHLYAAKPVTIWIDTPAIISAARITDDKIRAARQEDDSLKGGFQYIFTPSNDLARDTANFIALLRRILARS